MSLRYRRKIRKVMNSSNHSNTNDYENLLTFDRLFLLEIVKRFPYAGLRAKLAIWVSRIVGEL
jgi:hypothetical protein